MAELVRLLCRPKFVHSNFFVAGRDLVQEARHIHGAMVAGDMRRQTGRASKGKKRYIMSCDEHAVHVRISLHVLMNWFLFSLP